jgi:pimeloyl-ACP methyl ester carboxylesterase
VDRLVYLSWYPEPAETGSSDQSPDLDSPLPDDATVTLDDDSWLNGPEAAAWPDEVSAICGEHRRRPITRSALMASSAAEAWRTVPTTILIGRSDRFIPAHRQAWLRTQFDDVRVVDGDDFLLFLRHIPLDENSRERCRSGNAGGWDAPGVWRESGGHIGYDVGLTECPMRPRPSWLAA